MVSQGIQINELVSSNSSYLDENGDNPDWIELYNNSNTPINLLDWTITDKFDLPTKWTFPDIIIEPNEYLVIWASAKDRNTLRYPRTLITRGSTWKYLIPTQNLTTSWVENDFYDENWSSGTSGFGYADNDDSTIIPTGTHSVFLRHSFDIEDITAVTNLLLDVDYDDAFVAYINGQEVARANINGIHPSYNATPITDHEAVIYSGGKPDRFLISSDILVEGKNTLSIQAHNISANSSDFTIIPFLSAFFDTKIEIGLPPSDVLELMPLQMHTNFKISTGESVYLFDNNGVLKSKLDVLPAPSDVSVGIRPSDQSVVLYDEPSPGEQNGSNAFQGFVNNKVNFSHDGGLVSDLMLSLSCDAGEIRYTTDSSEPNENSDLYNSPISISDNTIVRARIFQDGYIESKIDTRSYIVDSDHSIPVISLVSDPENLFSDDHGIMVLGDGWFPIFPFFGSNIWEDWERPINFTLYEDSEPTFSIDAGTKVFGGWSRGLEQRSLSIFARGHYGASEIDFPIFPQNNYSSYQALVLRNSGNDFLRSNIRDATLTSLMDGSGIETQRFRPVATYINGDYWGMYNIREKVNEHYLASRHNVDPIDIDLIGPLGELIHGSKEDYNSLMAYLTTNSLQTDEKYMYVADQVDIDNFIIYQIAQIYFDNTDWPGNNIKQWKHKNGKWRWILYDTDFGFGTWNSNSYQNNTLSFALEPNGPDWPNPPSSTLLFRRLIYNTNFRNKFINMFADQLNSRFLPERVSAHIENVATGVASEVTAHYNRWGGDINFHNQSIQDMKRFGNLRPTTTKGFIKSQFGLPNHHELTVQVNNTQHGYIKVNSLTINNPIWKGDYFETVPIHIEAVAKPGYEFVQWVGASLSTEQELTIDLESSITLTALFQESDNEPNVVINEINYTSRDAYDTGDWIELYNPNNFTIDLSGWVITDKTISSGYTFEEGTFLTGNEYMILTRDKTKFELLHNDLETVLGDLPFGLSSSGDVIKLYSADSVLRDSVMYLIESPWPVVIEDSGHTIELKSFDLDNNIGENWKIYNDFGSPGAPNDDITIINDLVTPVLFNRYPNPFTNTVHLDFDLDKTTLINAKLYDLNGVEVYKLYEDLLLPGTYSIEKNLDFLVPGVYVISFSKGENIQKIKWVKQ